MRHDFIDRYGNLASYLHQIDPRIKLVISFAFLVLIASTTNLKLFPIYAAVLGASILLSKVPLGFYFKKIAMITPLALVLSFFIYVSYLFENDIAWNLKALSQYYPVYEKLALLVSKIYVSILVLTLLIATTRFNDLLWGLRKLKLPTIITTLSRLVYTYIFVLIDELHRMQRAYKSRTPSLHISRFKLYGNIAGGIFLRSLDRSDYIYKAMVSRGFDGEFPEGDGNRLKWIDLAAVTLFTALAVFIRMKLWNI